MSRDPHTPPPPQPDGSPLPPVAGEGGFSQQPAKPYVSIIRMDILCKIECMCGVYTYIYNM